MKVVIPMAGLGTRFYQSGVPKPLIQIAGKPMIEWAIESIKGLGVPIKNKDFIFICRTEHETKYQIGKKLKSLVGNDISIRYLDYTTEGAACTVLTAEELLDNEDDVLTCDCDQFFQCPDFRIMRQRAIVHNWGGIIPTSESTNPAYSYLKRNKQGNIIQTAEKQVISTHAAIGIYYFTKGSSFVWAAKQMIKKNIRIKNEFYLCPVYNELIGRGDILKIVSAKEWMTLGTPEEAKIFAKKYGQT